MATTNNNAIFNYETETDIYKYKHTYPFEKLKPKMGPLMRNERNDTIKYHLGKLGRGEARHSWDLTQGYTIHFKKPQMYREEVLALKIREWEKYYKPSGIPYEERIHKNQEYNIYYKKIQHHHFHARLPDRLTDSGGDDEYTSRVNNPFHFRFMYKRVKNMLKLKWKDIKEINEWKEVVIQQKYLEIIEWAQNKVEEFNQTSQFDFKDLKVGILKQNPHYVREQFSFKTFNGASFGNGKNNWLRKWCEEFIREFAHLNYLMEHVIYHYEKTMRMRTASAKISAWFLRMKYNPKSPYCQKWLWEDFEDICEDEDDRRHNPFYEKDINLRKEMETKYECPICLETEHAEKAKTLKCGHKFCRDCINKCLRIDKKCPYCRAPQ